MAGVAMNGAAIYVATQNALLGYAMDQTLFYQILGECQGEVEDDQAWSILKYTDKTQVVTPATPLIANSLYLTPFNLPGANGNASPEFVSFIEPKRAIKLIAADGITFRWLSEIPMERREEYKDDDTVFYIDSYNGFLYLCGTVDQQYTIAISYKMSSPEITATTFWVFPKRYHLLLAELVAMKYKDEYDYDVINAQQAMKIERRITKLEHAMHDWDHERQESAREGVDYGMEDGTRDRFYSKVVGDNNSY